MLTRKLLSLFISYAIIMIPACGTHRTHSTPSQAEHGTLSDLALVKAQVVAELPARAAADYKKIEGKFSKKVAAGERYFIDTKGSEVEPYQFNLKPNRHYIVDKQSGYAVRTLVDQAELQQEKLNVTFIVSHIDELKSPLISKNLVLDATKNAPAQRELLERIMQNLIDEIEGLQEEKSTLGFMQNVEGFFFPTAYADESKSTTAVKLFASTMFAGLFVSMFSALGCCVLALIPSHVLSQTGSAIFKNLFPAGVILGLVVMLVAVCVMAVAGTAYFLSMPFGDDSETKPAE